MAFKRKMSATVRKKLGAAQFKQNFLHQRGTSRKWSFLTNLKNPNWDEIALEPVKKDFYREHPLVSARDEGPQAERSFSMMNEIVIKSGRLNIETYLAIQTMNYKLKHWSAITKYRRENEISVKGHDCPKPIEAFSECSFSESVMSALRALDFTNPTPIQSQAIPVALSGRDMVGIAETGSGKTLAYILPAVTHILAKGSRSQNFGEPDIVVLSPTRELARQIQEVARSLRPHVEVTSECFYGGTKRKTQKHCAQKVFEICIATPGRMVDFLYEELVKMNRCTYFVLDEADRMLDMGFAPQIKKVIEQCRPDRQMLMFSATWPPEIRELAESYLKDYIMVNIGSFEVSANHNITQKIEVCEESDKTNKLVEIMKDVMKQQDHKTLIFVNAKLDVDLLTLKFRINGWAAFGLHGSKKQDERDQVFAEFKRGRNIVLIATDLAARGLDVDDIKFIINYDCPFSAEDYVHRIGRTGRCNRTGTAITLFTPHDRDRAYGLISVLEEANQVVNPKLREVAKLPRISKADRRKNMKFAERRARKKLLKRLVGRSQVNQVPLGTQTDANKLPELDEINPDILSETFRGKKKKKRKFEQGVERLLVGIPTPANNCGAPDDKGSSHKFQEKSSLIDLVQNLIPTQMEKKLKDEQSLSNNSDPVFMPDLSQNERIQNFNQATNDRDLAGYYKQPESEHSFRASGASVFGDHCRQNMGFPMSNRNMKVPADPRNMSVGVRSVETPWIPQTDRFMKPRYMGRPADFRNTWTPMGPVHMEPFENASRNNAAMPYVGQNNYTGINQNNFRLGWGSGARQPNSAYDGYLAGTDTGWRQQGSIPNQNRIPQKSSSSWNRWP